MIPPADVRGPPLYLRAAWVWSAADTPIADGALLIGQSGRVEWVGPSHAQASPDGAHQLHFPLGVAVPGFINTHTHLELSHLGGLLPRATFPRWLQAIKRLKDGTRSHEFEAAVADGLHAMWRQGVTTVGDAGSTGSTARMLDRLGGRGVAFQEVFGPHPDQAGSALAELEMALDELAGHRSDRVRLGVSPHAPYTVSDQLMVAACRFAERAGLPVAIHVAESPEEEQFVRTGSGPFAALHRARGIPVRARGRSTVAWLESLGVLASTPLCVHAVTLDADDVADLARRRAPVAHCPLSNRAHGHGCAPLKHLRDANVAVGLGTDSVASQEPLDLRAEARATGLPPAQRLRMLTKDGAVALGLDGEVGSLDVGKWGDVVVLQDPANRPTEPLVALDAGHVECTIVAGRVRAETTVSAGTENEWTSIIARARTRLRAAVEGRDDYQAAARGDGCAGS